MSQPKDEAGLKAPVLKTENVNIPCAVLSGTIDGPIIAGFEKPAKIQAKLTIMRSPPNDPFVGISLSVPLGDRELEEPQLANENAGFGVRHSGIQLWILSRNDTILTGYS